MSNEHVQGNFLFQKLNQISNEYVQVKHSNEILIFSSSIVLLVVLFSLKQFRFVWFQNS